MYGCESWTVKKAECWKMDAFELWCWRRLLRVPWTARSSNQSILKEISPGCSLEGLMLKLRLQYFGHLMQRVDSLEKTLMLEAIGGRRRRGRQRVKWWMASPTQCTWVWVNSGSWWWTGRPGVLQFMGLQRVGDYWATELNWTELKSKERISYRKDFKTGKLSQIKKGIPGSPWWLSGKESACHCKRHGFYPWSGRIPHAMEQLSPRATSMEPVLYRVQELQLLKPWHLELMLPNLPNKRSHCAQW